MGGRAYSSSTKSDFPALVSDIASVHATLADHASRAINISPTLRNSYVDYPRIRRTPSPELATSPSPEIIDLYYKRSGVSPDKVELSAFSQLGTKRARFLPDSHALEFRRIFGAAQ